MDLADLKRLATAAREFSVAVGPDAAPRHITLRTPTQHELSLAARRAGMHQTTDDVAATMMLERVLLCDCIVAWSGVVVGDVLPESEQAAEALVHEAGAVPLVLDVQNDWAQTLWLALVDRLAKRKAAKDTAAKNSLG
jgi:hypothetical protein